MEQTITIPTLPEVAYLLTGHPDAVSAAALEELARARAAQRTAALNPNRTAVGTLAASARRLLDNAARHYGYAAEALHSAEALSATADQDPGDPQETSYRAADVSYLAGVYLYTAKCYLDQARAFDADYYRLMESEEDDGE